MIPFVVRRVLVAIPVLWAVLTLTFIGFHLVPGDAAQAIAAQNALNGAPTPTGRDMQRLRHELGLDRPVIVQYGDFLSHAARLDFGRSIASDEPVFQEIWTRFPYTAAIAVTALALGVLFGVTAGVLSALFHRGAIGGGITALAAIGISVPNYFLGTMLALLFGVKLHWLPVAGTDGARSVILPAITVGVFLAAILTRLTRASVMETLGTDFVRTARAKGLTERVIIARHILKNALIPVVTSIGLMAAFLLSGVIIAENVFAWPGIGTLALDAIQARDYPVIEGLAFFVAILVIAANLLVDISYAILDPRIRLS